MQQLHSRILTEQVGRGHWGKDVGRYGVSENATPFCTVTIKLVSQVLGPPGQECNWISVELFCPAETSTLLSSVNSNGPKSCDFQGHIEDFFSFNFENEVINVREKKSSVYNKKIMSFREKSL